MVPEQKTSTSGGDHPAEEDLHRLMAGQLSPDEVRTIVLHLLRGCPACKRVTGRLWSLGEPAGGGLAMTSDIGVAQGQLQLLARRLGEIQADLRKVSASLPPGGDPEEQDVAVEIRAVIDCVLVDSIRPAIRDLRAAAEYSGEAGNEAPEAGGVDGKP